MTMDPIENKLREYHQKKKREDAQSTPDFETLWNKLESQKSRRRDVPFFRFAAAVAAAAVAVTGYLYLNSSQHVAGDHQLTGISPNRPLSLKVLEGKAFATEYIWTWTAPTDQLLHDVNQSLKKTRNEKL
jgi:hypothetical protein